MDKVKLEKFLNYIQPTKYIVSSEEYSNDFDTPVLTAGQTFILGYTNEKENIYPASKENPIILFDDFTTDCKWVDFPFKVKSSACKILTKVENNNIRYSYYAMKSADFDHSIHKRYWISNYSQMLVIDRDEKEKQKVVDKLDSIQKLIDLKQNQLLSLDELIKSRFIEMFETIDMSEERDDWEPLENLCKIYTGTTPSSTDESNWNGDVLWITPAEMNADSFYIYDTVRKITEKGRKSKSLDIMPVNTVLLSTRAPIGKVGIVGTPMACNQGFKNFECGDRLNPVFLYVLLKNNTEYLNSLGSGTTFLEVSKSKIAKTKVPVPNIEKQIQFENFVKQIDKSKFVYHSKYFLWDIFTLESSTIAYSSVVSIFECPNKC